jgi:hypothetical protein
MILDAVSPPVNAEGFYFFGNAVISVFWPQLLPSLQQARLI